MDAPSKKRAALPHERWILANAMLEMDAPAKQKAAPPPPRGRIITFYSYKGGTGRSMTMANVAWVLASQGKRVLVVDWDLEAPGIHRYYAPFLIDPELTASDGVIDIVLDYTTDAVTPSASDAPPPQDWYRRHADILRYAVSLDHEFASDGTLDFLSAGRQGYSYSTRVNTFDWRDFYEKKGGGAFLEAVKARMRETYDYILIDSRTGVSDTSGICTVQFPDTLVVCFTMNNQSIEGASAIAQSVMEQRRDRSFGIFPVPMRVELAEKEKLEQRRELARNRFARFPNLLKDPGAREEYWGAVEMLYVPYYAYEEVLAAIGDRPGQPTSLLAATERLVSYLTASEVQRLAPLPEARRLELLALYAPKPRTIPPDQLNEEAERVFALLDAEEQPAARRLFTRLVRVSPTGAADDAAVSLPVAEAQALLPVATQFVQAGLLRIESDPYRGEQVLRIADNSLLTRWQRLAEWIEEDRAFLEWRQRLRANRDEWMQSHDAGALLSGQPLRAAREWQRKRSEDLSPEDQAYIAASQRAVRQERWVRAAVLGFILLIVASVVYSQWTERRDEARRELAQAALLRADSFDLAGQVDSALAYYREAWSLDGELVVAYARSAGLLFERGDFPSAIGTYNRALELDPTGASLWLGRGGAYEAMGDGELAIRDYTEAIRLDSTLAIAYFNRGAAYQAQDNRGLAIEDFQQVIGLATDPQLRDAANARLDQLGVREAAAEPEVSPFVYLHFRDEADRARVNRLVDQLRQDGFDVRGAEPRTERTAGDVRFFFPDDRRAAEAIATATERVLASEGYPVRLQRLALDSARFPDASRGQIEVWLPALRAPVQTRAPAVKAPTTYR